MPRQLHPCGAEPTARHQTSTERVCDRRTMRGPETVRRRRLPTNRGSDDTIRIDAEVGDCAVTGTVDGILGRVDLRRSYGRAAAWPASWPTAPAGPRGLSGRQGDRIVLMMRNCPEFHVARPRPPLLVGATPISIYNSSSPEQVEYLAGHCGAKLAIVEDDGFLDRFTAVRDRARPTSSRHRATRRARRRRPRQLFHGGPVDLADGSRDLHPRRPGHRHLHVGHHRPAQGRDAQPLQRGVDGRGLPAAASTIEPAGLPARVVPADGPHRRADVDQPLPRRVIGGYEVTTCPDPGQIAAYAREVQPADHLRRARGCGRRSTPASSAALGADPEKGQQFDEARRRGHADRRSAARWATATDGGGAPPATSSTRSPSPASASCSASTRLEFAITGAAPIPAELLELVPGHRRARCRRSTACRRTPAR